MMTDMKRASLLVVLALMAGISEETRGANSYLLEKQAAEQSQTEPTRSVLYRSAATLALDCGEYREAERLVAAALAGTPPEAIANELREVLDAIYTAWNWREQTATV